MAVTYDDATDRLAHLYINGSETPYVLEPAVTGTFLRTSHPFTFGNRPGLDRGFAGIIDNIQIYNAALTAPDIAYLYANPQ